MLRILLCLIAAVCMLLPGVTGADEFDPMADAYNLPMTVTSACTEMPPQVDGYLGPREWDVASATTGFLAYLSGHILPDGPVAFLAHDETALHALVLVPCDAARELVAQETRRDGKVYTDDSVELYLQTPAAHLFQFVVNPLGALADFRDGDITWNGSTMVAAGEADATDLPTEWGLGSGRYWFAELSVPLADLGAEVPRPNEPWAINIAVNRGGPWACLGRTVQGLFADPSGFCPLRFLSAQTLRVQITSLGRLSGGDVRVTGRAFNPGTQAVELRAELDLRKEGSTVTRDAYRNVVGVIHSASSSVTVPPGSTVPLHLEQTVRDTSVNRMALRVSEVGGPNKAQVHALRHGPVSIRPPLALTVGNVPSGRYLVVTVDTAGLGERAPDRPLQVLLEALNDEAVVVRSQGLSLTDSLSEVRMTYGDLSTGRYRLRATASPDGADPVTSEAAFNVPGALPWLTSTLYDDYGRQDRVLKPWTPVQALDNGVAVWGRDMRWGGESILPASVTSQGAELLASPLQILVTVDGQELPVRPLSFAAGDRTRSRLSLTTVGVAAGITFIADIWVEYDGFLWVTLRAEDPAGRQVERVRILARLQPAQATLYQTFCRPLTGHIGQEPIRLPWMADRSANVVNFYHWVGNEDRGLGFTYETLQHWAPLTEDNFCTIAREPDAVTYCMNLVEKPCVLDGRVYRFGIQATPIKPLPPDWHSMVTATYHWQPWQTWQQVPGNIDAVVIWPPHIMPGLNAPYKCNPQVMEQYVQAIHDRGIAALFTGCPQKFSPQSDEFEDWRLEWQTLPESVLNWESVPQVQNCGRSLTLRKWLFYGWAIEIVQRFGLDGIYYDGWMTGQIACSNPHHGCGWVDESGRRQLTVPVLEGREFNQRLAAWLEDHVVSPRVPPPTAPDRGDFPRYIWRIHSWEFVPSVMGFGTSWLTGEFAGWPLTGPSMLTPEGTLGRCVGLDLFRTRCLSTNWGVPNLFHAIMWEHTENHPTDRQTLNTLAWLLPHGTPLGELCYMNQVTTTHVLRTMVDFGTRSARFIPCWRPNPYLKVESPRVPEVLVATWDHQADRQVLAVVSNLQVTESAQVELLWTGFPDAVVTNALTGGPVALTHGRIQVALGPEEFVLLRFSPP